MDSETKLIPHLEVGSSLEEAEMTVILLHGLGADGHDFEDVAEMLVKGAAPRKWRFVLPHAPKQAVTINQGMVMPAWYDILEMDLIRKVDWPSVNKNAKQITALIEREKAEKIVIAGFSQGGAMSLHIGLRHKPALAGILAMSGYLLASDDEPCPQAATEQEAIPIGLFHGSDDPVVPYAAGTLALDSIKAAGHHPILTTYDGLGHSVNEQEIRDLFGWLEKIAAGDKPDPQNNAK